MSANAQTRFLTLIEVIINIFGLEEPRLKATLEICVSTEAVAALLLRLKLVAHVVDFVFDLLRISLIIKTLRDLAVE